MPSPVIILDLPLEVENGKGELVPVTAEDLRGNTILHGEGAPSNAIGVEGDYYLDELHARLYGAKGATEWPVGFTSLVGPAGPEGPKGSSELGAESVTTADLKAEAVTSAKLANLGVTTAKLAEGAVTEPKLAAEAVTAGKLAKEAVTAAKLAPEAVEAAAIKAEAVTEGKLANNAVTAAKIANNAVVAAGIKAEAVTEAKIATGAVTEAKIGAEAVAAAKIKAGAVTAAKLGAEAVETAAIKGEAVTAAKLAAGAVTATKLGAEAVETAAIKNLAVTEGKLAAEAVTAAKIKVEAVTEAKLAAALLGPAAGSFGLRKLGTGAAEARPGNSKIITNTAHAWVVPGEATVLTLPGPIVIPAAGETVTAVRLDYKIREGTNIRFKLQKGGVDLTGFTGLEATKVVAHVAPAGVAIASGEELTLVIESVSATPKGFSATLQLEHSAS